ncbi:MAG: RNA polymerase sigma factor [Pseudomonadota bacterium]
MADSDREALLLLRQGNPQGFDALYARYRQGIYAFAFRLTGRRDTADDIFQETWMALARRGTGLWLESNVGAWLFAVARNAFLTTERRQRTATVAALSDHHARAGATGTERGPDVTLSDVERALLALTSDDRQLLLLVGIEGLAQEDVARILEIAPAALRQRVGRARARLAALLDQGPGVTTTTDHARKQR